jgi:enoyl-CoA hydratase/carnithine racemase
MDLVIREDRDGLCTLTLNRPEKRNAVNRALFKALARHVTDLEAGGAEIGCIVLRGAGRAFCAGHDLAESGAKDALGWLRLEALTIEKLNRLPQPVIASIHGYCMTAGLELALAADILVAAESAVLADTHGKWGLVPGWGMSQRLPRRVGAGKALEMMLTSRRYSGREAEAMGLVNVCVPDADLDASVAAFAADILANSWHSNAANKRLIYESDGMRLEEGIAHEVFRNEGFATDRGERTGAFEKGKPADRDG